MDPFLTQQQGAETWRSKLDTLQDIHETFTNHSREAASKAKLLQQQRDSLTRRRKMPVRDASFESSGDTTGAPTSSKSLLQSMWSSSPHADRSVTLLLYTPAASSSHPVQEQEGLLLQPLSNIESPLQVDGVLKRTDSVISAAETIVSYEARRFGGAAVDMTGSHRHQPTRALLLRKNATESRSHQLDLSAATRLRFNNPSLVMDTTATARTMDSEVTEVSGASSFRTNSVRVSAQGLMPPVLLLDAEPASSSSRRNSSNSGGSNNQKPKPKQKPTSKSRSAASSEFVPKPLYRIPQSKR